MVTVMAVVMVGAMAGRALQAWAGGDVVGMSLMVVDKDAAQCKWRGCCGVNGIPGAARGGMHHMA